MMKMKNRILKQSIITVVVAILATTTQLFGQQKSAPVTANEINKAVANERNYCPNEISVWLAGGLSTLNYNPEFGNRSNMAGGAFGIGYGYYWSEHFGFLLGAELALYQSKFNASGLQDNYNTVDLDVYRKPEKINFRYRLDDYEEMQQLWNINIPLSLQFQSRSWSNHRFYAGLGFKLGIPLKANYEISDFGITSMGYYYDNDGSHQVLDDVNELGFGEFNNKSVKGEIDFGLLYTGTLETGVKWNLGSSMELYTGLYFDYTFNNIMKGERNKHTVEYNSYGKNSFDAVNSVLASQYAPISNLRTDALSGSQSKNMVSNVSPIAFGLKLRLGIGACSKEKADDSKKSSKKKSKISTPPPAKDTVAVTPSSNQTIKVKSGMIIAKLRDGDKMNETPVIMSGDAYLEEEFRRAVAEYGSSLLGVVNIELEGYELDQSELTIRMKNILRDKAEQIREVYGYNISIVCEGHTCNVGKDAYNIQLGQKRADEVRKFLISRGFQPSKVTAVSKGQYLPIVPNTTEANKKKNRRVMLIIKD